MQSESRRGQECGRLLQPLAGGLVIRAQLPQQADGFQVAQSAGALPHVRFGVADGVAVSGMALMGGLHEALQQRVAPLVHQHAKP